MRPYSEVLPRISKGEQADDLAEYLPHADKTFEEAAQ
jgi:hypothetical protein